MEINEWSDEFDVLFNNVSSNQAPGLSEYEKSIFLTAGQEETVFNWFNPQGNKYLEGFDDSIKRQMDFSELVVTASTSVGERSAVPDIRAYVVNEDSLSGTYTGTDGYVYYWEAEAQFQYGVPSGNLVSLYPKWTDPNQPMSLYRSDDLTQTNPIPRFYPGIYYDTQTSAYVEILSNGSLNRNVFPLVKQGRYGYHSVNLDDRMITYQLPSEAMLILNEVLMVNNATGTNQTLQGIPITFDEYTRIMSKPYHEPLKRQFWRMLSKGNESYQPVVEIIPHTNDTVQRYTVRYVRRPRPIILEDLSTNYGSNVSINGETAPFKGELNPIVDRAILNRAVVLAKNAYYGTLESDIALEQRTE